MISLKPLFKFCRYHGINNKMLAEKTGVSYPAILKMHNSNKFSAKTIDRICQTLNINIDQVMRYEKEE